MKKLKGIEKRTEVLYVRVKPSSKTYVQKMSKKHKVSESQYVCAVLQAEKIRDARNG